MTTVQERFEAKIDRNGPTVEHMETPCWIWMGAKKGGVRGGGAPRYGNFWLNGRRRYAHRVAYHLAYGELSDAIQVDHICLNTLCCNPTHLRLVTGKQNRENLSGANRNSWTGIRGVSPKGKRWRAQVCHNRVKMCLGVFDTIKEAEDAVRAKRLELYTHNEVDKLCS